MKKFKAYETVKERPKINIKKIIVLYAVLFVLVFAAASLKASPIRIFSSPAAIDLALVVSIGFVFGEKAGAIFGIFAGTISDLLGGVAAMSPLYYMLTGYFCGALVGWFLSSNFISFTVYALLSGIFREAFVLLSVAMSSESFNIKSIIVNVVMPDIAAFYVCVPLAYLAVLLTDILLKVIFKEKDRGLKKDLT